MGHGTMAERIDRIEQALGGIEGTIARADQSTHAITATLHKELQAKQSLVNELRDAYDEMRKQSETSIKRSESTSSLRAKSGSRDPFLTTTLPGPTAAFRAKSGSRDTLAPKSQPTIPPVLGLGNLQREHQVLTAATEIQRRRIAG